MAAVGRVSVPGILRGVEVMASAPWYVTAGWIGGPGWMLLPAWCTGPGSVLLQL